ncbi:carboxypeptidase-like regulatory domain-containing protein [soil metagenome]
MKRQFLLLFFLVGSISGFSQQIIQTVRGTVTDRITQMPLVGVTVFFPDLVPVKGTATDINGEFKFTNVPVGKQTLQFKFIGYEEQTLSNITVISGKELVLKVDMDEKVIMSKEVTISAETEKNRPLNEMALVSTRTFSVEETQKFAAAVNDPARMASSFAGVVNTDDGNNNISIRGNSPNGLQWRMEGVEIPNPNHFSSPGTAGGGISILSAQLLSNSDFMTGAFPAEYGNALSGVFDLRLRKGNNEKPEFTVQTGFLGLDLAAEGPIAKGYQGSYLINYRYSTLSLIGKIIDLGDATTNFQDLSFNFFLPTKKAGTFTLFGFGGWSGQTYDAKKDSSVWEDDGERYSSDFSANTVATGVTHSYILGKNTYLKSALLYSYQLNKDNTQYLQDDFNTQLRYDGKSLQDKVTFSSTLNHKFNTQLSLRSGVIVNRLGYDVKENAYDFDIAQLKQTINASGSAYSVQMFTAMSYRITHKVTLQGGLHYLGFLYNQTGSLEPRASVRYAMSGKQTITFGYGLHSQLQPIGVYFAKLENADGSFSQPNKNIGLNKAHHFVASYDRLLTEQLHIKTEFYYQALFNIPIGVDTTTTYSMINQEGGYFTDPVVNTGKGRNVGMELTLEQFMHRDFYFLLSGSLYDSKYRAIDKEWRNTRWNGNYAVTFTSGKEFKSLSKSKNKVYGVNIKLTYSGGQRSTPVDLEASQDAGTTKYVEKDAFTLQNPYYFRTDVRFSMKRNRPNATHTLSLDIQNVTNRKNIYGSFYDVQSNKIKTYYQAPLIPILSYKIEF